MPLSLDTPQCLFSGLPHHWSALPSSFTLSSNQQTWNRFGFVSGPSAPFPFPHHHHHISMAFIYGSHMFPLRPRQLPQAFHTQWFGGWWRAGVGRFLKESWDRRYLCRIEYCFVKMSCAYQSVLCWSSRWPRWLWQQPSPFLRLAPKAAV